MGIFNNRFTTRLLGLIIVGIVFIGFGLSSLISALSFRSDIRKNIENQENIIDFMYQYDYKLNENVCGYIYYLYECFCEETTTRTVNGIETSSSVSGSYYLMPITNFEENDDNIYYITVLAKDKDFTAFCEQLVDETYAYLDGDDNVEFTDLFFTGKIKPLEDEVKDYLVDWATEVELFEDNSVSTINKYVLPYQLEEYNMENHFKSAKIFIPIGVLITAVCVVILVIALKKNKNQTEEQPELNTDYSDSYNTSYKTEGSAPALNAEKANAPAVLSEEVKSSSPTAPVGETKPVSAESVEEAAEAPVVEQENANAETNTIPAESGMLSAAVSAEDIDNLPNDGSAKPAFNYDDGGMGGIDVSVLDLSSLDNYKDEKNSDESTDNNIYSSDDDEEYTFDSDPASILLSDMDK